MNLVSLSLLLACLIISSCSSALGDDYVRAACSVTRYEDICIRSLASFSGTAKTSPSRWARAGVAVTISEAKRVAKYLHTLRKGRNKSNKAAISDCVECFQDALDNLHKSLGLLRKLSATEFGSQMGDVTTWVSAALTDEDTCLDGFEERKGKRVRGLVNRVTNVTHMTSNALALVNKLATTGPDCLVSD